MYYTIYVKHEQDAFHMSPPRQVSTKTEWWYIHRDTTEDFKNMMNKTAQIAAQQRVTAAGTPTDRQYQACSMRNPIVGRYDRRQYLRRKQQTRPGAAAQTSNGRTTILKALLR